MLQPQTCYVDHCGSLIAYQVFGEGDVDLIVSSGLVSNCDHMWDIPVRARILKRLAHHFRVILFDRRGTGHSDPLPPDTLPTWEDWSDDLLAVMEAADSNRAVVHGERDGGFMALLFAAMHPDRTVALSLGNTSACYLEKPDYPIGMSPEDGEKYVELFRAQWGSEELVRMFNSGMDEPSLRMSARMLRGAATPRLADDYYPYKLDLDVRSVLPSITVPVIVFHNTSQRLLPIEHGRYLAEHIPGARLVELPGLEVTALFSPDGSDQVINELVAFVTGRWVPTEPDRVLATVLFCDIVDSTRLAAELGDRRWHQLLDQFYTVVRNEMALFDGREVDTAGDGFFMAFDRPTRAIRCAVAIRDATQRLELEVRSGLHFGECTSDGNNLTGLAVHVGARIAAMARPNEIWVSETTKSLAMGSGIGFQERGTHQLKGVPDNWTLFVVA